MKNLKILTCALFALLVAACGGGGGGGNPANPIPDAVDFLTTGFTAADATTIDNAVDNRPNFGSITQSSNGSGGTTTDSFSMAYTDTGFRFSKTNSVDSSKSWAEKTLDIANGNRNNGSGDLYFYWDVEIPFFIGTPPNVFEGTMYLTNETLISRIRGNQFAYINFNDASNEGDDEVIGGFWNVLTDHDNKMNGILDDIRAHVNVSTFVLSDVDLECAAPCRISSGEAGAFVDGTEWSGSLPVSGSATYYGEYDSIEAYDAAAPGFPLDYTTHSNGGFATVMVTFGGNNSTSIEGILGDELTLSATPWDPNLGNQGAFYGEDTIGCSDTAALCESVSSSIFAAQFFGANDVNDGNPSLIGGTYSVDNLRERGYLDDNGSLVETPLRKDVIGGFSGAKQ